MAEGFGGPIKLTFLTTDGRIVVLDAVVDDGRVFFDLVDLTAVAAEAGFSRVRVAPPGELADVEATDPRSDGVRGNAPEVGREPAADLPNEPSDVGAGDADDRRGPPIEPPGRAGAPSGPPEGARSGPPEGAPSGPPAGPPKGPPDGVPAGPPAGAPAGPPDGVSVGPPSDLPVVPADPLVGPDGASQQP